MKPLPDTLAGLIGQPVDAIDTPTLVVDLDAMTRNTQRMAEFARRLQMRWRPHAKTHKSSELALFLMQAGAIGVCVQKTSEAEAMARGGVRDIFITNEVIAPQKLRRVAALAGQLQANGGQLAIAVDHPTGIERLIEAMEAVAPEGCTLDVYVEIDVGHGRCGIAPGAPAVALAEAIARQPRLRFAGLQAYQGRAQHLRTPEERRQAIAQAIQAVQATLGWLGKSGVATPLVEGGGTGDLALEAASGVYGELQTGSFLFMDADYAANERDPAQPAFEHALFVRSQVMSVARDHVVCDAGHKSHAIDSGLPRVHAPEGPALLYANGGDEHGVLRPTAPGGVLPRLGDTVWLVPGHCDPTINLHDVIVGVRGGLHSGTVERLIRIDARGALW
jgi:D-serine deaminase-like pyridoxal phosphate-dependent protein